MALVTVSVHVLLHYTTPAVITWPSSSISTAFSIANVSIESGTASSLYHLVASGQDGAGWIYAARRGTGHCSHCERAQGSGCFASLREEAQICCCIAEGLALISCFAWRSLAPVWRCLAAGRLRIACFELVGRVSCSRTEIFLGLVERLYVPLNSVWLGSLV